MSIEVDQDLPEVPGLDGAITNAMNRIVAELTYLLDDRFSEDDRRTMRELARDVVYHRLGEA